MAHNIYVSQYQNPWEIRDSSRKILFSRNPIIKINEISKILDHSIYYKINFIILVKTIYYKNAPGLLD